MAALPLPPLVHSSASSSASPNVAQSAEGSQRVAQLQQQLAPQLDAVKQAFKEIAPPNSQWMMETLTHTLDTPGKLLRPILCLLASQATLPAEQTLTEAHTTTAAVAEMIHVATLLHDDVLDDADMRRGKPAVRVGWGNTVAILTGDYLLAQASRYLAKLGIIRLVAIYSDVLADLCDGEVEQLRTQKQLELNWDSYLQKTLCKTASLFAAVCESAGVLNELPEEKIQSLKQFGLELGLAFQLIDDLLDYQSSQATTGKPVLNDLKLGLITAPVLLAFEDNRLSENQTSQLTTSIQTLFNTSATTDESSNALTTIQQLLTNAGTYDATRQLAINYYHSACQHLASVVPDAERRQPLEDLGQALIFRNK